MDFRFIIKKLSLTHSCFFKDFHRAATKDHFHGVHGNRDDRHDNRNQFENVPEGTEVLLLLLPYHVDRMHQEVDDKADEDEL